VVLASAGIGTGNLMLEICTEYFISGVIEEEGKFQALFF
jgi:hypothetical protein